MGDNHAPSDQRNIAEELNHTKKSNRDSHVTRYRGNIMDTNGRIRQGPHKKMPRCTRIVKQKTTKSRTGPETDTPTANNLNSSAN